MELKTIYADDLAKIQTSLENNFIRVLWLAHPDSLTFRAIISKAHEFAQEHHLTKWLCNFQRAEFLEVDDQHWLVEEIFASFNPQFKYHFAYLIIPVVLEVLTTFHIHDLVNTDKRLKKKIEIAIFKDIHAAHQWLFPL